MTQQPELSTKFKAIQTIDHLLASDTKIRDRLGKLCRAMLEHRGRAVDDLSNAEAITSTLSGKKSAADQRFFAAVFVRLLAAFPAEFHSFDPKTRTGLMKLLHRLPEVAKSLKIDKKAQGFEREQAFEQAPSLAEGYLRDTTDPPKNIRPFNPIDQRIMRMYQNPLVSALIVPFLPHFLEKRQLRITLTSIHDYLDADARDALSSYREAMINLEGIVDNCTRYDTRFVREYFLPFFSTVLEELDADFESSPVNRAGALSVRDLGKKYPFAVAGAEIQIAFAVENGGAGVALDVQFTVEPDDCLSLSSPMQFLDEVGPNTSFEPVEFLATVDCASGDSVPGMCRLSWTNGDGSSGESEDIFELPTQRSDIPWATLDTEEPYSLEPVRHAKELVGRSKQLKELVSRLTAPSVGSFWIHGQRRVGKTSIVQNLDEVPGTEALTILNLDTGMFIDPDGRETVNNLGRKICTRLVQSNPRLSGLAVPPFDGALSPLDDFLSEALTRDPELRVVIVLDEFDNLPLELYERDRPLSNAFFMTLRSLSAQKPFGFILVGGEKMPEILGMQGEVLNKFRPLRIDYLDRESQWSDFQELVRKPVAEWATIRDDAVLKLYEETAGNPFFTNLVCGEMVKDMLIRRDAFVTGVEMNRAIRAAVEEAGSNQFQHFWDDGVVSTSADRTGRERAARRRVLIALGETLRSGLPATEENIVERASRLGLSESEVLRLLAEFDGRKVLARVGDRYTCKVGLFQRWLVDEGIHDLTLSLVEQESLRAELQAAEQDRVKNHEITSLVQRLGSYCAVPTTDILVRTWLEQFATVRERRVMYDLLTKLQFYSGALIREKLRIGRGFVRRELAQRGVVRKDEEGARKHTDNVLISYFGGEGKTGSQLCQALCR